MNEEYVQAEVTMSMLKRQPCRFLSGKYISKPLAAMMTVSGNPMLIYDYFFNLGYIYGIRAEREKRKAKEG